ncbi:hypothetical protein ATCC90586_011235 [Pythium insidiosum]|nr:hypothetical protein ATCC90586_011235 [Pythium insidiosum]
MDDRWSSASSADGAGDAAVQRRSSSSPRDDGDERMLSMEELKAEMFRSLRDAGTVDSIRVRALRSSAAGSSRGFVRTAIARLR